MPTSTAAFVGSAPRGPVDRPVHITGWADYEKQFGGLDRDSPMSYAVHQFYLNGGREAEIVRLVGGSVTVEFPIGKGPTDVAGDRPVLKAASPGSWARKLRARVDHDTIPDTNGTLYNLTIRDCGSGLEERYRNISTDSKSPRSLGNVLSGSRLVTVKTEGTGLPPAHDSPQKPSDDPLECREDEEGVPPTTEEASGEETAFFSAPETTPQADDDLPPKANHYSGANGSPAAKTGIYQLLKTDIFNLLCLPDCPEEILTDALKLCVERRAVLLVDPPQAWTVDGVQLDTVVTGALNPPLKGPPARNAALYFPRVLAPDRMRDDTITAFPPCGVMAGVLARTDAERGVWKAPAGTDASLNGVIGLEMPLTDVENGRLNPLGINCLRLLPGVGPVAWGARTLRGADRLADEWKYLPVRRLALFVEESLFRGTQWVVFEPNDEPLWSSIRLNVGAFMNSLFREGAFQGRTPEEAYLVKCDRENNPQNDIDRGIVNIQVGFAPLKPAEFVIIHIEQLAGQIQT
ncbi:phage tail sheath C-terminal domain-containing protein [Streptomyces sp. ISL-11]|uniref:phage tail sheath family protein n=1 Tax=Streptomyces sp. ISL-11 TaxID=2819174 RepID=UPI0027E4CD04|nr:phage tail sheath C-terminal domain-containing protein [Streptomyces sp. ISL-11]